MHLLDLTLLYSVSTVHIPHLKLCLGVSLRCCYRAFIKAGNFLMIKRGGHVGVLNQSFLMSKLSFVPIN